jgi:uncharacterized protein YjiS (DUF1127 family)
MTDFSIHSDIAQEPRRTRRLARFSRILLKVLWDFRTDTAPDLSNYSNHIHQDVGLERRDSDRHTHTLGMMSHTTFR